MAKRLSSLPVKAKVQDPTTKYNGKSITWQIMEHGHTGDPAGSTALITEKIISLKCFDAKEANNADSGRKTNGNNRYLYSNILSWANSAAANWYTAKHSADAPPTNVNVYNGYNEYDTEPGFLANFSANFKNALLEVSKITARNTITDGGSYETVKSKIFLLSNTEAGLANENSVAEGSRYAMFSNDASRSAYPTAEVIANNEYTGADLTTSKPWWWWLRTPDASNSCYARRVSTDGSLSNYIAYNGNFGVRPACVIPYSILVSDSPNADGAYEIQWNAAPTITTPSTNLGDKNLPFSVEFSVNDADADAVKVVTKLDTTTRQTISNAVLGQTYTEAVTRDDFKSLINGQHTITITASDSFGNTTTVTVKFTKTQIPIIISGVNENWGNVWMQPSYSYTIEDLSGHPVTVVESIDGETVKTIADAPLNTNIQFDLSGFPELSCEEEHTMLIYASNDMGVTSERRITFTKLAGELSFYTEKIPTDAKPRKILVRMDYFKGGNPAVKVEVTNNADAIQCTWEDMTAEFLAGEYHTFSHEPKDGFGIAVKVTIIKNENTERVYIENLAYCFA